MTNEITKEIMAAMEQMKAERIEVAGYFFNGAWCKKTRKFGREGFRPVSAQDVFEALQTRKRLLGVVL